jgi:FecR protein
MSLFNLPNRKRISLRFLTKSLLPKKGFSAVLIFLCSLSLIIGLQKLPAIAQRQVSQAEITQILDGTNVFIQNKLAKVNESASKGQRVRTANARAQLTFNTGAVGRLAQNSVLTVGQCARLQSGTLLVNGAMNGCTSSVVAGVRGTTYLMEVAENGQGKIKVLEGEVRVSKASQPLENTAEPPAASTKQLEESTPNEVVLSEGEQVEVSSAGAIGAIEQLTQEEFSRLLKGALFNGFSTELPGIGKIQASFQRLFPGVPFPLSIRGLPRIPTPRIPVRIPFF